MACLTACVPCAVCLALVHPRPQPRHRRVKCRRNRHRRRRRDLPWRMYVRRQPSTRTRSNRPAMHYNIVVWDPSAFSKPSGKAGRVNVGMRGWCFVFDHGRRYIAFGVLMPFAVLVAGAKHRIGEAESWGQRQTGFPLSPILPCTMSSAAFRASAAVTVVSAVCISCVASSGHGPSTRMTPYSLNTASSCCAHLACSASLVWPRPGSRRTATCRWLPSRAPNQDPLITSTTRILSGRTAPFSRFPYS